MFLAFIALTRSKGAVAVARVNVQITEMRSRKIHIAVVVKIGRCNPIIGTWDL
jgi:hypothetical protein